VYKLLREIGVTKKLDALERRARIFRRDAEEYLQQRSSGEIQDERTYLFYTTEESEEFE
jgi:hypothetical protein